MAPFSKRFAVQWNNAAPTGPGVYRIWWPDRLGDQPLYIGEAESIHNRIDKHARYYLQSPVAFMTLIEHVAPEQDDILDVRDRDGLMDLVEAKTADLGLEFDWVIVEGGVEERRALEADLIRRHAPYLNAG